MQVSAGHMCVCVFVSVHAPFHPCHPPPRLALGTSASLWWVYQIGSSCHPFLLGLVYTLSTTCSDLYICLAQIRIQDCRCRFISIQSQVARISEAKDNHQQCTLKEGHGLSGSWELIHNNVWGAVGQTENEQHVMQVTGRAGVGVQDEGRLQKVKSWLGLAAGGTTGEHEMWSGGRDGSSGVFFL